MILKKVCFIQTLLTKTKSKEHVQIIVEIKMFELYKEECVKLNLEPQKYYS